jgi:Uma2 family endonuclease
MSQTTVLAESRLITGQELLAMGDIGPCELIDGRIVTMTPTGAEHARLEFSLGRQLGNFVAEHELGWVLGGEVGIYTHHSPDRIRGADIAFISKERVPDGPPEGFLECAPDLVVEIISPNDRWQDVRRKIKEYFEIGVQQIWIVEPENGSVLVYRSLTEIHTLMESDTLIGEGPLEGFSLPVLSIFTK